MKISCRNRFKSVLFPTKGLGGLSLTSFVSGFFSVALLAMVHLGSSKVSFCRVLVQSDAANSVAMAIADVFPKNGYTILNKNAKILKIFERLKTLKSRWVISGR